MLKKDTVYALILAAGLSSRMKAFKPLMPFRGKTLIENSIDSVFSGGAEKAVVVTGYRGNELNSMLSEKYGRRIIIAENKDYAYTDMLYSIKIGCASMPECDAFFLLPGDMPLIKENTFCKLMQARNSDKSIIFPTLNGYRKHPPLIDFRIIPDILNFDEDGGLRNFWKSKEEIIREVCVDDEGVKVDLDTQDDYNKYKN